MRTLLLVLVGVGALVGVLVWTWDRWLGRETPPALPEERAVPALPDPRITYTGPFLNVRPEVQYVGDARCAKCHPIETDGFHHHPMGRSLLPVADLVDKLRYDEKVHNPFEALQSRFFVQREKDRLWNTQQRLDGEGKVLAAQRS